MWVVYGLAQRERGEGGRESKVSICMNLRITPRKEFPSSLCIVPEEEIFGWFVAKRLPEESN